MKHAISYFLLTGLLLNDACFVKNKKDAGNIILTDHIAHHQPSELEHIITFEQAKADKSLHEDYISQLAKDYIGEGSVSFIIYDQDFNKAAAYAKKFGANRSESNRLLETVIKKRENRGYAITISPEMGSKQKSAIFLSQYCFEGIQAKWSRKTLYCNNEGDLLSIIEHELTHAKDNFDGIKTLYFFLDQKKLESFDQQTKEGVIEPWLEMRASYNELVKYFNGKRKLSNDYLAMTLQSFLYDYQSLDLMSQNMENPEKTILIRQIITSFDINDVNKAINANNALEPKYGPDYEPKQKLKK